jgi:hypothetical protein
MERKHYAEFTSTPKMEAVRSSETLVASYKTSLRQTQKTRSTNHPVHWEIK